MPSAREAIEALIFAYSERLDAGDLAGVGQLFEHARYGSGGAATLSGAEVAKLLEEIVIRYEDGTPRTKHVTTNLVVEVDEDAGTATARSYYQVLQQAPGEGLGPIVSGRYADRFECVDGSWRFSEREVAVDLVGDLSRHLRQVPKGVG